jgi:hypothetical protein
MVLMDVSKYIDTNNKRVTTRNIQIPIRINVNDANEMVFGFETAQNQNENLKGSKICSQKVPKSAIFEFENDSVRAPVVKTALTRYGWRNLQSADCKSAHYRMRA